MSLLTDQEIEGMGAGNNYPGTVPGMQRFARAIEAAVIARLATVSVDQIKENQDGDD